MATHWFRIVEILYQNDLLTKKKMHQEYHQLDATNRYFHSQCAYYKIAMTIKNWLHIVYSWPTMNFYSKHYKHIVGMKKSIQLYKKCWKIRIKMLSSRKNNAATEENCSFPPCIVNLFFYTLLNIDTFWWQIFLMKKC